MDNRKKNIPTKKVTTVVGKSSRVDALRVRKASLRVIRGPDQGLSTGTRHLQVVVGTSQDCGLALSDVTASNRHFEIFPADDKYILRDLESSNGTVIRGLYINQATLQGGEEIQAGQTTLLFSLAEEQDELPLSNKTTFGSMIGRSVSIRRVFAVLERASTSDEIMLLEGESGTGKSIAAENLHIHSSRKDGPFVVVDIGAVAPTLVESELFGHVKGSFTGADRDRPGVFESAGGGTVLLDEISEIYGSLQVKLLHLLDEKKTKRIGENQYMPVDVRIIAATNRDLAKEVEQGRFREDLFYRLSVVRVRLPPLRERCEDIGPLAKGFIKRLRPDLDPDNVVTDQVMAMFINHDWPGNVRELRNVIVRLLLFPDHPKMAIKQRDAWVNYEPTPTNVLQESFKVARKKLKERFERAYLSSMLDACDGIVALAAKKAGIPRQTLYRLIKKYKLKK